MMVTIIIPVESGKHRRRLMHEYIDKNFKVTTNDARSGELLYLFISKDRFEEKIRGIEIDDILGWFSEESLTRFKSFRSGDD